MPNYIRANVDGGTYFFTVVTYQRQRLLGSETARRILQKAVNHVRTQLPFEINAWVLLPDHFHCILSLPQHDHDFSKRLGMIKATFSKHARHVLNNNQSRCPSRQKHREATFWQRRFWEHQIRDEQDYRHHMDYIHYNPVKHGLVHQVQDWPWSSFHRYVRAGIYTCDWGGAVNVFDEKCAYGE